MEFHKVVAKNIYSYRKSNKMSLDTLSKLTGVSTSALNEIEKGNTIPSINTVWKITNGLKISFSSLMSEEEVAYQVIRRKSVVPITEGEGKYKVFPYFPYDQSKSFEFFYVELEKKAKLNSEPHLDNSEEYIMIVEGQLRLIINNDEIDLSQGDAVKFNSDIQHLYYNFGDTTTKLAMIIYYN
jgi:transcriptional regulator with XRE-family HTH domain